MADSADSYEEQDAPAMLTGLEPGGRGTRWEAWELLEGTLRAVAWASGICAYVGMMALLAAHHADPRWDLYAGPMLLVVGAVICLGWRASYRFRATILVASLVASCLALNLAGGMAQAYMLYPLACLVGGVLLGPGACLAIAVLGTISIVALGGEGLWWNLGSLWLTAGLVWAALGNLFQTVRQAQADEAQAWLRAAEARTRRGELVRAQKALNEMYDLLQRTNHELAIARLQADEARQIKAQFAANVSHELRTPLNLIMGFSEMMIRSPEVYGEVHWTPALRADIREIHRASRHLLGMVDDILDLSRIEAQRLPLRMEATDLRDLIREAVATSSGLLRGKDVELITDLPPDLPQLLLDRTRIRQVLLNLLNNAIRFTDQGSIRVSARVQGGQVVVAVTDTGVGIPAPELSAIFEEFRQAQGSVTSGRGGAGLGLAICRQFVRLHGGQVEAESEVGKGSTFRFRLPVPDGGPVPSGLFYYAPEGWSPPVPENPLGKAAIILGADSAACAIIARAIAGYRTLPMASLEGLAAQVEAEHPAGIVLLDDGATPPFDPAQVWEVAGRSDIPIIRCPAPSQSKLPAALGVAGYLVKPIQGDELLAAIRRICPHPQSILLVDDDPGFVALLQRILSAEFASIRLRAAYSGREALDALAREDFDLVLLDLIMPEAGGLQALEAMRQDPRLAEVAVIVTTGSGYAEEERLHLPGRLELLRPAGCSQAQLGRYLTMLLDALPPDYSHPAPYSGQPAAVPERPAS